MAIKRRVAPLLTTGTTGGTGTGTARTTVSLGAPYGRVIAFEFKGDDANVDDNNTLKLTDATGRILLTAIALDAGTDDSTTKQTNQTYSTVGVYRALVDEEDKVVGQDGVLTTDNVGAGGPLPAASPITIDIAAGTDGDVQQVVLWVEV